MDNLKITLEELSKKSSNASSKQAILGFDGFVDTILDAVDKRSGPGDNYTTIDSITDFGERIKAAAGKSTNIEMYPTMLKLGGNGPIMANAMLAHGVGIRYIGALGKQAIHEVFEDFAKRANAVSICDPGFSNCAEFHDGKIILGNTSALEDITYDNIVKAIGEGAFFDMVSRADLIGIINWTMTPHLTSVYTAFLDKVLPNLPQTKERNFFFDLTDPAKRPDGDIAAALRNISRFASHGHVTLGLNLAEAQQVFRILDNSAVDVSEDTLKRMAARIRSQLEIQTVVIHPTDGAACATKAGEWYVAGPYCKEPLITTGAGDHFNAGFATAQLLGMRPEAALTVAVSTSGYYVRSAKSPSMSDLDGFIRNWQAGSLG